MLLDVITEKPNDESGNAYVRRESTDSDLADIEEDDRINKPMTTMERRGTTFTVMTEQTLKTDQLNDENDDEQEDEFFNRVEKRLDTDWYHLIEKEVQRDTHMLEQE